jgi:hypothetical protein
MVMASSDQTHDEPKQGQLDNRHGESGDGKNWLAILLVVFLILALFAAFILLVSMSPESTGTPELLFSVAAPQRVA